MPKIERKAHEVEAALEEDIEIQGKRFRLYFQNKYTILSLTVDLLTGFFYIIGSVAALTSIPDRIGMYFYLAGSIFLTIRPILRIIKNIFIYDDLKAEKKKKDAHTWCLSTQKKELYYELLNLWSGNHRDCPLAVIRTALIIVRDHRNNRHYPYFSVFT